MENVRKSEDKNEEKNGNAKWQNENGEWRIQEELQ